MQTKAYEGRRYHCFGDIYEAVEALPSVVLQSVNDGGMIKLTQDGFKKGVLLGEIEEIGDTDAD